MKNICKSDRVAFKVPLCNFERQRNALFVVVFFPPELQVGTRQKELLDIDSSSVILEDGITKLNTIGHYEVRARLSPHVPVLIPSPHCTLRILQHHVNPLRKL